MDIQKKSRPLTSKRIGEVSSIYGYHPEKFEEDLKQKAEEYEKLYNEFVEWMKNKNVDPRRFRSMFAKYYEEFIQ